MQGTPRFVGQVVATLGYFVLFVLVGAVAQLSLAEALIPAAVLLAYALSAQLFPAPWRYWLATGPWLLVLVWFVYLWEGGLDCGSSCDDGSVGTLLLPVAALGFAGVIVAGTVSAIHRWSSRRR